MYRARRRRTCLLRLACWPVKGMGNLGSERWDGSAGMRGSWPCPGLADSPVRCRPYRGKSLRFSWFQLPVDALVYGLLHCIKKPEEQRSEWGQSPLRVTVSAGKFLAVARLSCCLMAVVMHPCPRVLCGRLQSWGSDGTRYRGPMARASALAVGQWVACSPLSARGITLASAVAVGQWVACSPLSAKSITLASAVAVGQWGT